MFPPPFVLLFWVCFAAAAYYALRMGILDRRMQAFRQPSASRSSFVFVPLRWQEDLYTAEGRPLVAQSWRAFRRMLGLWALAAVFGLLGY